MPGRVAKPAHICPRCLRRSFRNDASNSPYLAFRPFSQAPPLKQDLKGDDVPAIAVRKSADHSEKQQGAMSRRLAEATEDALLEGGRAGRKAVEEAGFSEELKSKLLERVKASAFKSENVSAFVEANVSSSVGRGSRDIATASSWTGTEETGDAVLRMLDDARKPLTPGLRGPARIPSPVVDMRLSKKEAQRPGERLANARDKTSIYAIAKDSQMSDKEREDMRRNLKERFGSSARAMPNSIRGLAALANERIEDAIARGQFKNIPRGKAIERDARADNPFLDTTEYIMNKMIQRQDIVPPWIEKQQELVKAANVFRMRLRNDWKRHAARTIASCGGSLIEQMERAESYAMSERFHNPRRRKIEEIAVPTSVTADAVMVQITQKVENKEDGPLIAQSADNSNVVSEDQTKPVAEPLPPPFRIPSWEAAEMSYLKLAVNNLNSLTRSYNLMAPDLAKKPYFSLDRELRTCYADVAPELAEVIKQRAARPPKGLGDAISYKSGGVFERFGGGDKVKVYDSKKPLYGFKQFWNDLFKDKKET